MHYSYICIIGADTYISVFDLIIFLGVIQGIFISWFFIRSGRIDVKPNLYQGLLLLFLTISSFGITCSLYWFVVRPFNVTRVVFGMKPLPHRRGFPHVCGAIYQPAMQAQDQYGAPVAER